MEFLKSTKFKLTILRIGLVIPIALCIVLPLFLFSYKEYFFQSNLLLGIIIPTVAIIIAVILGFFIKQFSSKIKNEQKLKKIWLSVYVFFLIVSLAGLFVGSVEVNFYFSAYHYNTGPVLTWGSNQDPSTEVTVMWRTFNPTDSSVIYGTEEGLSGGDTLTVKLENSVEWHQIAISGLTPNIKYYYQVENFDARVYSFTTAPAIDSTFNFLVFADTRQNSGDYGCIVASNVPKYMAEKSTANGDSPEFTVVVGDVTVEGTRYATWKSWFDDISVLSGLASNAPLVDAVGNHERHEDPHGDILASFYPLEKQSNEQFYYSFDYGQIHFTMLDPWNVSRAWWGKLDNIQYNWAKDDLQNAMNKKFRIICLHPPPISKNSKGVIKIDDPKVVELAKNYEVDIVFFGHDHDFDYNIIDGTHYLLNGVGGNMDFDPSGYAEVKVTPNSLTLMEHWENGSTQQLAEISPSA